MRSVLAELNLKQIVDKLNTEFTGDTRKLVFWYDEKGEVINVSCDKVSILVLSLF